MTIIALLTWTAINVWWTGKNNRQRVRMAMLRDLLVGDELAERQHVRRERATILSSN